MQTFSQKYTIAYLLGPLPDGFDFKMQGWPLHVTLADVFAVDSDIDSVIKDLAEAFKDYSPVRTTTTTDEWFGTSDSVHVMLLERTQDLQALHDDITHALVRHGVKFNNPEYIGDGFKPHSTIKGNLALQPGIKLVINSFTLIDMFPDGDAIMRKILATIHFAE